MNNKIKKNRTDMKPKSIKNQRKSINKSRKIIQNGSKNRSWRVSWGLLGCSWGLLGGSWGHLGPKRAPRAKNSSKTRFALPPWTPQVGPKNRQKSILRPSKSDHFFDDLLGGVLMPFGANLAPTWSPKPSQNRPKLGPSWTQVGNFEGQVASYMKFGQHHKNLEKPPAF